MGIILYYLVIHKIPQEGRTSNCRAFPNPPSFSHGNVNKTLPPPTLQFQIRKHLAKHAGRYRITEGGEYLDVLNLLTFCSVPLPSHY